MVTVLCSDYFGGHTSPAIGPKLAIVEDEEISTALAARANISIRDKPYQIKFGLITSLDQFNIMKN